MEAHLGVTVIIHMKDEDHPDQGVSDRNRNTGTWREMGHRKICKWAQKKLCFGDGDSEIWFRF